MKKQLEMRWEYLGDILVCIFCSYLRHFPLTNSTRKLKKMQPCELSTSFSLFQWRYYLMIKINISMVPHQHRTVKLFYRKTGIVASLIFSCLKPWTQKGFGVPNLKKKNHWINTAYMYVFQNVWVVNHKCSNLQLEKTIFEDFMFP